jgi:Tol biopolymer transport system component
VATWLPQCVGPFTVTADLKHAAFRQWATQDVVYVAGLDPTGTHVTAPRRFTHHEGRNIPSGFSPDGKSLVFVSDAGGAARLLRQPVDSDTAEMLADDPRISGAARLSPDGAWVYYVVIGQGRDPTATHRLMRVPTTGGRAREVLTGRLVDGGARCTVAPATLCAIAERSSDRRQLVFTAFDAAGGRGRELIRFDCDPSGDPRWALSPEGKRIAVLDSAGARIHVLSLAGQRPYVLDVKDWSGLGYVSWTADGQRLLVPSRMKRGTSLLSVDLQGGARVLWEQEGSIDGSAIASPDGRQVAIWVRAISANIWMADLP